MSGSCGYLLMVLRSELHIRRRCFTWPRVGASSVQCADDRFGGGDQCACRGEFNGGFDLR